jgi:uncharacterized protein YjbJ (UPF0337 family)
VEARIAAGVRGVKRSGVRWSAARLRIDDRGRGRNNGEAAAFVWATQEGIDMANEDQTEGKTKDIGGKVKEEVGDATGNDDMKHEGQGDQAEGKVQKGIGDAKEKLSDDK